MVALTLDFCLCTKAELVTKDILQTQSIQHIMRFFIYKKRRIFERRI